MNQQKPPYIVQTLNAITRYLREKDQKRHTSPSQAYCLNCESITLVGGNYRHHLGNDCNGPHYETRETQKRCLKCKGDTDFIEFDMQDFKILKHIAPEDIFTAINNSLTNIDYFHNPKTSRAIEKWKSLSPKEKLQELDELYALQDDLKESRDKRKRIQERIQNLEVILNS